MSQDNNDVLSKKMEEQMRRDIAGKLLKDLDCPVRKLIVLAEISMLNSEQLGICHQIHFSHLYE